MYCCVMLKVFKAQNQNNRTYIIVGNLFECCQFRNLILIFTLFSSSQLLDNDMALCTYVSNALVPKHFIMLSNYAVDFANTDALESKFDGMLSLSSKNTLHYMIKLPVIYFLAQLNEQPTRFESVGPFIG